MSQRNRVVVITGAGGGIGRALCRQFAETAAIVIATDINLAQAEAVAHELREANFQSAAYQLNVTDTQSVREAVEKIVEDFGQIDILINNAGVWEHSDTQGQHSFETVSEAQWKRIFEINLYGTIRMIQHTLPHMIAREYGRVINVTSIAGVVGLPGYADYSAAKAGVLMLTKVLAMENAKRGITVNSISPGMIAAGEVQPSDGTWVGMEGGADDVARAAVFIADDKSHFITGADLLVDGGRVLGPHGASFIPDA